jgi:CheY-like chemotaxis protein
LTAHSDGTDKGATFVVKLPLALAERVAARGAEGDLADGAASAAYSDLTGVRVLLVDDDPDALELGTMILSAAGADVRVCRSVADALVTFERWRPHVLISDIEMPGENGYTFIRKVRARGAEDGGRVPAVALTAYGRTQDRTQALTAGFSMHVPKPVDPGELTAIVASLAMRGAADRPV